MADLKVVQLKIPDEVETASETLTKAVDANLARVIVLGEKYDEDGNIVLYIGTDINDPTAINWLLDIAKSVNLQDYIQ